MVALSIFARELTPEEIVSAKITDSQIEVTYIFPEGYHQTLQKDYFYIETEEMEGITFEPTVYPKGKLDEDGNIEYHGETILSKKFTIDKKVIKDVKVL